MAVEGGRLYWVFFNRGNAEGRKRGEVVWVVRGGGIFLGLFSFRVGEALGGASALRYGADGAASSIERLFQAG